MSRLSSILVSVWEWSGLVDLDQTSTKGMCLMKIRTIVNAHLGRERLDALIAVLVPFVLMVESGYACGWVFADGDLSLTSPNTYWSLARGLFLEGLIYAVFKLVRMFVMHPKRSTRILAIIPLSIGCMAMSVS